MEKTSITEHEKKLPSDVEPKSRVESVEEDSRKDARPPVVVIKTKKTLADEFEEAVSIGGRALGGSWRFLAVMSALTFVGAFNLFVLQGALDLYLFGAAVMLALFVLVKIGMSR